MVFAIPSLGDGFEVAANRSAVKIGATAVGSSRSFHVRQIKLSKRWGVEPTDGV